MNGVTGHETVGLIDKEMHCKKFVCHLILLYAHVFTLAFQKLHRFIGV